MYCTCDTVLVFRTDEGSPKTEPKTNEEKVEDEFSGLMITGETLSYNFVL